MYSLILIQRYSPSSIFWSNMEKSKRFDELSVEELLRKYQGFEGEPLLFYPLVDREAPMEKIKQCLRLQRNENNCVLLHVFSSHDKLSIDLSEGCDFVGYDVGVCEKEKTIFSSIFNEVLFGHMQKLVSYKYKLNKFLLFSDEGVANEFVQLHNQLSIQGEGVEDFEQMIVYEIWRQKKEFVKMDDHKLC